MINCPAFAMSRTCKVFNRIQLHCLSIGRAVSGRHLPPVSVALLHSSSGLRPNRVNGAAKIRSTLVTWNYLQLRCHSDSFDNENLRSVTKAEDGEHNTSCSSSSEKIPQPMTDRDVDEELLRYDYDEFEEIEDGELAEEQAAVMRKPLPISFES